MAAPLFEVATNATHPAENFAALTPSDSVLITVRPRQLFVAAAGDVVVKDRDGTSTTFSAVAAGVTINIRPTYLMAATTATVVALY